MMSAKGIFRLCSEDILLTLPPFWLLRGDFAGECVIERAIWGTFLEGNFLIACFEVFISSYLVGLNSEPLIPV